MIIYRCIEVLVTNMYAHCFERGDPMTLRSTMQGQKLGEQIHSSSCPKCMSLAANKSPASANARPISCEHEPHVRMTYAQQKSRRMRNSRTRHLVARF